MKRLALVVAVLVFGAVALSQVTISFWHSMRGRHGEALEELIAKFHRENPGIRVEAVFQGPYGTLHTKLIAAVAAKTPPTIAQQYENWTVTWLDALVDLDLLLPEKLLADIHPRHQIKFGDRIVTVPFNKSVIILYYRPDLIPTPPKTWAEFEEMVVKIGKDEAKGIYATAFRPPNPEIFLTYLAQAGGHILSPDWKEVLINNEAGLEAAEFVARVAPYALVQAPFISGAIRKGLTIAMWIDTSAGYPWNIEAARAVGVTYKVALAPAYKTPASMIQGTNLAIFSMGQTKAQVEAAAKFIEFLLREDNTVYWAKKTGYLPVTKSAISGEEWQKFIAENEWARVMTEQFEIGGFHQILHPRYLEIRDALITFWELLLKGERTPKELLDALATDIAAIIK